MDLADAARRRLPGPNWADNGLSLHPPGLPPLPAWPLGAAQLGGVALAGAAPPCATDGAAVSVLEIDIPKDSVGKVIGSKGKVIQLIRQESGADVQLSKDAHGTGTVIAKGSTSQLAIVQAMLADAIAATRVEPLHEESTDVTLPTPADELMAQYLIDVGDRKDLTVSTHQDLIDDAVCAPGGVKYYAHRDLYTP